MFDNINPESIAVHTFSNTKYYKFQLIREYLTDVKGMVGIYVEGWLQEAWVARLAQW